MEIQPEPAADINTEGEGLEISRNARSRSRSLDGDDAAIQDGHSSKRTRRNSEDHSQDVSRKNVRDVDLLEESETRSVKRCLSQHDFEPVASSLSQRSGEIEFEVLADKIKQACSKIAEHTGRKGSIAAFFGSTGVGKTTTINFICGASIVECPKKSEYDDTDAVDVREDQRGQFLKIGHGKSMTKSCDFLSIQDQDIFCCDMPGSSDDEKIDAIVNCVVRSQAVLDARSLRPVLVLKLKGIESSRYQNTKEMLNFMADCFVSVEYFSNLLILVTHSKESNTQTFGNLDFHLESLPIEGLHPAAIDLLKYVRKQTKEALQAAKQHCDVRERSVRIRIVRPLDSSNRNTIMDFIKNSDSIDVPSKAMRFNLEEGAIKSVRQVVGLAHADVANSLEAYQYNGIGKILQNLDTVGKGLKMHFTHSKDSCLLTITLNQVLNANKSLSDQILLELRGIMSYGQMVKADVSRLSQMMSYFEDMHIIREQAGDSIHFENWKSVEMLQWSCREILSSHIATERKKGWSALDLCAQKIVLVKSVITCNQIEDEFSIYLKDTIQQQVERVQCFNEPACVADAMRDLQQACELLTDVRKEEAEQRFEYCKDSVSSKMQMLLEDVCNLCSAIENGDKEDQCHLSLQKQVTKLFCFTRPEQRINLYLPEDKRSESPGGFYRSFRDHLRLDQTRDSCLSRQHLLQHFNLLTCLIKIDDDDLRNTLVLHMDSLKAQIKHYMVSDFQALEDAFKFALPQELFPEEYKDHVHSDQVTCGFNSTLQLVLELLQIDKICRDRSCTDHLCAFMDKYCKHVQMIENKLSRDCSALNDLALGIHTCFVLEKSIFGDLIEQCQDGKFGHVKNWIYKCFKANQSHGQVIENRLLAECENIRRKLDEKGFTFCSIAGLMAANSSSAKLDLFARFSPARALAKQSKESLLAAYSEFLHQNVQTLRAQTARDSGSIQANDLIEAFKNLLPSADPSIVNYLDTQRDIIEMDELNSLVAHAEMTLIGLANEPLDHSQAVSLSINLNAFWVLRNVGAQDDQRSRLPLLKEARDKVNCLLGEGLREARSAADSGQYDNVANFLESCSARDKQSMLMYTSSALRAHVKRLKNLLHQLSWLENMRPDDFTGPHEHVKSCRASKLFSQLDEEIRLEVVAIESSVQQEIESNLERFNKVLERRLQNEGQYQGADAALRVLVYTRTLEPQSYRKAVDIFQTHLSQALAKIPADVVLDEKMQRADEKMQRAVVDVAEICKELHETIEERARSAENCIWRVLENDYRSFRENFGKKIVNVLSSLKLEALSMMRKEEKDMGKIHKILEQHNFILTNLSKASVDASFISKYNCNTEEEEFSALKKRSMATWKARIWKGDYDAVTSIDWLQDDNAEEARKILHEHIGKLQADVLQAERGSGKSAKKLENLKKLKVTLELRKNDDGLVLELDCFLRDLTEKFDDRMSEIAIKVRELSKLDVTYPLSSWNAPLKSMQSVHRHSLESTAEKAEVIECIEALAEKIFGFVDQQLEDIRKNAKSLEFYVLGKVLRNITEDSASETLNMIQDLLNSCGRKIPGHLGTRAQKFESEIFEILDGKAEEVIREVKGGIPDKTLLAGLFCTLKQAAYEEKFKMPLARSVTAVKEIFKTRAKLANEVWDAKCTDSSDQFNNLVRTLGVGEDAFQEVAELQEIARECLNQALDSVRKEINEHIAVLNSLSENGSTTAIAIGLLAIRKTAAEIDLIHSFGKKQIQDFLSVLQVVRRAEPLFLMKLGEILQSTEDASGRLIICENGHIFRKLSNKLYNQHMKEKATLSFDQVVQDLVSANPNGNIDAKRLRELYNRYWTTYDKLVTKSIKDTVKPIKSRRKDLLYELKSQVNKKQNVDMVEFLATVCAVYSFCKSAEFYTGESDDDCIVQPHEIQILSIIRLLSVDSISSGLVEKLFGLLKGKKCSGPQHIENHFMQIPTGEGKSIVLGIVAFLFALQGWSVDCVCYSRYLSKRDESEFMEISEVLREVTGSKEAQIRYMTFEQLCEYHIKGIRDAVSAMIEGRDVQKIGDPTHSNRLLLIDEADVFFTKRFYGNVYCPGVLLKSPEVKQLIQNIWRDRRTSDDVTVDPNYERVLLRYPCAEDVLKRSCAAMWKNVRDMNNPKFAWCYRDGQLGYKVSGEFLPATEFRHNNRTVFAFLNDHESRNPHITAELLDQMLAIDIKCGAFSYAALPSRYYSKIFGVTGTLETLSQEERSLLRKEYAITKETYIPSAYGTPRLDFSVDNQLHMVVAPNEGEWIAKIDAEIDDSVKNNRAVLVCFKNDVFLQRFLRVTPKYEYAKRLDANIDESDLQLMQGIVSNATLPCKVTLLTRKFGRGLNFQASKPVNDSGGVVVVQTFFSSSQSEQIQIRGRTARQGEKGAYRMIMCAEHLKKKFGFSYSEGMTVRDIKEKLDAARVQKIAVKFESRSKKKLAAEKLDAKSWEFRDALYEGGFAADVSKMLCSLDSSVDSPQSISYILLLDVSGSMRPYWEALKEAFQRFLSALEKAGHGDETLITVVTFDNSAKLLFKDRVLSAANQLPAKMPGGGGTSFGSAFTLCFSLIASALKKDPSRKFSILFMTDGDDQDPDTCGKVMHTLKSVGSSIRYYHNIAFKKIATALEDLEDAFTQNGIGAKTVNPENTTELAEAFESAVEDSELRMK